MGGKGRGGDRRGGTASPLKALSGEAARGGGGHTVLTPRGWAPHHLKCKEEAQSNPASPYPNILHHHFLNRDKDWSRYPLPVTSPTIGGTWAAVQMGMGVHGRESTGPLNLPLLRRGGPPGQGGEIVQGRAQARAGSSTQRGRGGDTPTPSRIG